MYILYILLIDSHVVINYSLFQKTHHHRFSYSLSLSFVVIVLFVIRRLFGMLTSHFLFVRMHKKTHLAWWLMTGKSYVKFFSRLQDNNNKIMIIISLQFAYIVLQSSFEDCRLFPIRKMEFGTENNEKQQQQQQQKMVHDSMKRIACRVFLQVLTME